VRVKTFDIYRYDPDAGDNPRLDSFEVDLDVVAQYGLIEPWLKSKTPARVRERLKSARRATRNAFCVSVVPRAA
jgi:succinate dehydrogenase / fumarate reductase iron-sulfur subunit